MGVMCNILVNRTRDFYTPGEPVTGIVKYAVDEETTFEDIVLSYVGKGHCSWSNDSSEYYGTEEIFRKNISILPKDKAQDDTVALPAGAYEAPFQFTTPHHIPPTYKDFNGEISYKLKVKFKRPGTFAKRTYTANGGQTKNYDEYFKACKTRSLSIPDRGVSNFTLSVPSTADLFTVQNSRVVAKEYFVKVLLRLPMPYINASVDIPVVISGAELAEDNELSASMPSTSAGPSTEAPPTYEDTLHDTVPTCMKKMPL